MKPSVTLWDTKEADDTSTITKRRTAAQVLQLINIMASDCQKGTKIGITPNIRCEGDFAERFLETNQDDARYRKDATIKCTFKSDCRTDK